MASAPKAPGKAPEIKLGDIVLDRYRVVEQIGSGGHSVVYKGNDERLSRPVCIKVFSGLGGGSGVGRTSYEHFVQEAFALSRLTHPNTLRIYDFGHIGLKDADGMPLQVCEFMNGGTLSNVIREQGKQPLQETVRVIGAMCSALAEAHALGIVHRDIKPQNILFGAVGGNRLPKLADFGIAKWSADTEDSGQRAEDTAIVAGQKLAMYSPSWAAPEQLAGQPVSPATDIYSLACVAIYMLSSRAIFADEDVYAGYKKRRHADELVRETLNPIGVPKIVVDALIRALAFDPKKRLARIDELAAELAAGIEPSTDEQAELLTSPVMKRHESELTPLTPTNPVASLPPASHHARVYDVPPAVAAATAPTPPVIPDSAPPIYKAPATQPWMTTAAPILGGMTPRRLALGEGPQQIGDRRVHFAMIANNTIDLVGPHGTKLRITLIAGPGGARVVHVKGLTCFVAPLGGRPSPAVQIDRASDVALVTPRAQEIAHVRINNGTQATGHIAFAVGSEAVAVGIDDCADPILFDFGPGSDAYFVYTRGRTVPKSGRRG